MGLPTRLSSSHIRGSGGGSITGDHPVLDNPTNLEQLTDFLEDTYKPYFRPSQVTTLYLDKDAGSDTNTGQSSITAVASIEKVTQLIHDVYSSTAVTVNVALATTAYTVPFGFVRLNNVKFVGAQTTEETRNITSVTSTSNTAGIVFVVDGATLTNDVWAGRIIHVTDALSNTRNIIVARNTGNTIYGAMHNRNFLSDVQSTPSGGDAELLELPVFDFPANSVISDCTDLNFQYIKATGGNIFVNGAGKVQFIRTEMAVNEVVAGLGAGNVFILSTGVANVGNATNGILAARNKGQLQLGYGNVYVDTNIGDAAHMFIKASEDGALVFQGGGIFRGLSASGLLLDGGNAFSVLDIGSGTLSLVFENQSGSASCTKAIVANSLQDSIGYSYLFPKMTGEITGNFLVEAELAAQVKLDANTSVTTGTITNAVSADGGSTNSARADDGTVINGGDHEPNYVFNDVRSSADTGYEHRLGDSDEAILSVTSGGALFDIASGGSIRRTFTANGNVTELIRDDATYSIIGDLDPFDAGFSQNLLIINADFEPSGNTGFQGNAVNISARRITASSMGAMHAFNGTMSDAQAGGTVTDGAVMSFSANVTGGATYTSLYTNDVNMNFTNGSTLVEGGGLFVTTQGSSGTMTEVNVVNYTTSRTGTFTELSLIKAVSNSTPVNQYVINVDDNFVTGNTIQARASTPGSDKFIPWSPYSSGGSQLSETPVGDAAYTALLTDGIIIFDTTLTADRILTLPAASTANGKEYYIKIRGITVSSTFKVTIDGNSSETIDGSTTQDITIDYTSIHLRCDGTTWDII